MNKQVSISKITEEFKYIKKLLSLFDKKKAGSCKLNIFK